MVNDSKKAGLGRTLNRVQRAAFHRRNPRKSEKHTVETNPGQDNARLNLRSVTAQTNLDEFLEEAQLAGKQFITERRNIAIVSGKNETELYCRNEKLEPEPRVQFEDLIAENTLSVPRRPKWDANTTPEQLEELEKHTFLVWRRKLAKIQENKDVILTPFEKNLEVWRQLWRVIERSDIVVQILDCRNPLLYLCDDLIEYVDEEFKGTKMNLVLLNKADFLTLEQRRSWSKYFKERNIKVIFFSALLENEDLGKTRQTKNCDQQNEFNNENKMHDCPESDEDEVVDQLQTNLNIGKSSTDLDEDRIYDKFELIDTWRALLQYLEHINGGKSDSGRDETPAAPIRSRHNSENPSETCSINRPLTVGLVGYPNVGKSSTINALLSAKRVAVSATPGKTKHFQTFFIDRDMMLCDCPGLVFPNFVSCKSEMVINGILPIDQMKDAISPVRSIVERIPRSFFAEIYGLAFENGAKRNITADDLLNSFGFMRGYMTARGLPDISRASRIVCKDYINGKILYCEPPPNVDPQLYHSQSKLAATMKRIEDLAKDPEHALRITERQRRLMSSARGDTGMRGFDAPSLQEKSKGVHIQGLPGIGDLTQPVGKPNEMKVAKRERKHKKKEKLRRVYGHLDN